MSLPDSGNCAGIREYFSESFEVFCHPPILRRHQFEAFPVVRKPGEDIMQRIEVVSV